MKSTVLGAAAEQAVSNYLTNQGFLVLEKNWKRPRCEIDLVVKSANVVYFVEVKYRTSDNAGSGFDYITPAKLRQMDFAARLWAAEEHYEGDYQLLAAQVSGMGHEDIKLINLS